MYFILIISFNCIETTEH